MLMDILTLLAIIILVDWITKSLTGRGTFERAYNAYQTIKEMRRGDRRDE